MKRKNGFTLIELIAVLVILAILALIVTPLVMNIIRKARISADKRSIDAYGRSVEYAIATYLLDNGKFPTSIEELTIEYTGDEVVCSTSKLNSDSSVYLTGCTVGGRSVDYTYGSEESIVYDAYEVGDEITYNGVDYYVIENSGINKADVLLLKKNLLTVDEVNQYGLNHVNMYLNPTAPYYQKAYDIRGDSTVGGMQYYSSATCVYDGSNQETSGCTTNYADSEIKFVVDAWAAANVPNGLQGARLITVDDLTDNLGMEFNRTNPSTMAVVVTEDTPTWIFTSGSGPNSFGYWISDANADKTNEVWFVFNAGLGSNEVFRTGFDGGGLYTGVRPVINLLKSAIN